MNRELISVENKDKFYCMLCICIITGIIGAGIGNYIVSAMGAVSAGWVPGLIGFLVGFFAPIFFYLEYG